MRSIIEIEFKCIGGKKVNEGLLALNPKLLEITQSTTNKVCLAIEKYFLDHKIKIKIKSEVIR